MGTKLALTILAVALSFPAAATPDMTPAQERVRPISDTNSCEFLKTAYFEVSHPAKIHYYATKNVVIAGGDSYKIETTNQDAAVGIAIHGTTIGIYKCADQSPEAKKELPAKMESWKAEVLKQALAHWHKPTDPAWTSPCEIMAKFQGDGELENLSWVKQCGVRAVDKSIVRAFKDAESFPPPPDPRAAAAGVVFTIDP